MTKVYQQFIDSKKGDCMRATMASLFDKDLLEVPDFLQDEERWHSTFRKFLRENGYDYEGMLHNNPDPNCLPEYHISAIDNYDGINGLFFASVYSPKYFSMDDYLKYGISTTHAVVIDKKFNIIHDPNPNNTEVKNYPMSNVIGFNGILNVYIINKV